MSQHILNVSKCAVKLIQSYLTKRSMCVRYKGATSDFQSCPGGGPQGGLLTGVLFCMQVNKAGRPCVLPGLPSPGTNIVLAPAVNQIKTSEVEAPPVTPTQEQEEVPLSALKLSHYGKNQTASQPPSLRQKGDSLPPPNQTSETVNRAPLCQKQDELHKKIVHR